MKTKIHYFRVAIVVIPILALFILLSWPIDYPSNSGCDSSGLRNAQRETCRKNLEFLDDVKKGYAGKHNLKTGDCVTWSDLIADGYLNDDQPHCPQVKVHAGLSSRELSYELRPVGEMARCKISSDDHKRH